MHECWSAIPEKRPPVSWILDFTSPWWLQACISKPPISNRKFNYALSRIKLSSMQDKQRYFTVHSFGCDNMKMVKLNEVCFVRSVHPISCLTKVTCAFVGMC